MKLLEEEEKEEERKERRTKEREKKLRKKERLKGKKGIKRRNALNQMILPCFLSSYRMEHHQELMKN